MARIPAADASEEIRQEVRSAAAWHHVGILASPNQHVLLQPGYLAAECRQPAAHLAIFFGYAQMKTRNIWVPVIMHYLNNNLIAVVAGSADVISGQVIAWGDVLILLVLIAVLFAPFIFSKAYGKEAPQEQKITEEYTEF